jgi:hypothetical protein
MCDNVGKGNDHDCSPDADGVTPRSGGKAAQWSGPVVITFGIPSTYCTIGGENQCPLPLYLAGISAAMYPAVSPLTHQSTALLNVEASDASIEPIVSP